jgi:two-component system NtrC family response regulator
MILIVDDDASVRHSLGLVLKQAGYAPLPVAGPQAALTELSRPELALILQDMNFSRGTTGAEGLALLERIRARRPDLPVILITAWGSIALAVAGMKAGAADFITKPWTNEQLLQSVRTTLGLAATRSGAREARTRTREELDLAYDFREILGRDPRLLAMLEVAGRVSRTDASVLITGESGTGKELVAAAIHRNSLRHAGPFVKVNLGGVPPALFESEMFGHVKGAFTDARRDRVGRFALAIGGTIFLDEVGELEASCQVKLLRVLQDRQMEPLGSSRPVGLDLRVIAATNRDLKAAVEEGRFREDLLYRLNLIALHLPPLRERPDDIPLLARHFLAQAAATYGRAGLLLGAAAQRWMRGYAWPGNARQLRHLIERAVLVSDRCEIAAEDLQVGLQMESTEHGDPRLPAVGSMTIEALEKAMIRKSLEHHGGNVSKVALALGLSRAALYRRLEKYGLRS